MSSFTSSKHAPTGLAESAPTLHSNTYDFISPEQFDLAGRAVFITDADSECGRQAALSFARAGASHIGLGLPTLSPMGDLVKEMQVLARKSGHNPPIAFRLLLDITNKMSVEAAYDAVMISFGRLDIVVNTSTYQEPQRKDESDSSYEWRLRDTNDGALRLAETLSPLMFSCRGLKTVLHIVPIGEHILEKSFARHRADSVTDDTIVEMANATLSDKGMVSFAVHPGNFDVQSSAPGFNGVSRPQSNALTGDTIVWLSAERRQWLAGRYLSAAWDMQQLSARRERIEKEDLLKVSQEIWLT